MICRVDYLVAIFSNRLLWMVLPMLLTACDPLGPGAIGQLIISPDIPLATGRRLEMRAFADDGKPFDPATVNWSGQGWLLAQSWDLAGISFPFSYEIGGGMGYTDHQRWRLVAWISGSEGAVQPRNGEWYGSRLFNLDECGMPFPGYCGVTVEVDLAIEHRL